jgi:uncharacterized protein
LDLRVFEEYPAETVIYADPTEFGRIDECLLQIKAAAVELAIQKAADEYYCQGQLTTRAVVECARCLREFETDLVSDVSFVLCAEKEALAHSGSDEEEYVCFQGNELRADIVVPVRQALVLSMPMKPLCTEGCLGLCATCGTNLNEQTCNCKNETPDPRWDDLKKLLPDQ